MEVWLNRDGAIDDGDVDLACARPTAVAEGEGEAARIRAVGFADADKTKAIGMAQAEATAKQVEAYGGPQYQLNSTVLLRFAQAIENGKLPLVPQIVVGGNGSSNTQGSAGNLVEAMLAMMMSEKGLPHSHVESSANAR